VPAGKTSSVVAAFPSGEHRTQAEECPMWEAPLTETQWLAGDCPDWMLGFLKQIAVSGRKLCLFGLACAPKYWQLPASGQLRPVLEAAERYVDEYDRTGAAELQCHGSAWGPKHLDPWVFASYAASQGYRLSPNRSAIVDIKALVGLLYCVFGNPFRKVTIDPAWVTPTVASVAQAAYDQRAFDRLPILADALEDAGCDSADILNHCRQPGEHVRGCWVVDLLLGKK
jgi:hypothetical protein